MKSHEAIFFIGFEKKKDDSRDECEVGECSSDIFCKQADLALGSGRDLHGATTTGAEGGSLRHACGAIWTGER